MKVGLAKMLPSKAEKAKPEAPEVTAEAKAIAAFLSALKDWDEKGAAKALTLAIRACIDSYEDEETEAEDEEGYALGASASPDEDD